MKKQIFALTSVVMIAGAVTFSSCNKEDITAPVISITGGNSQSQALPTTAGQGSWTNPTVTATDDEDGDLSSSVTVSGTVNPNLAGTYTLTYTVSDAAGNTATEVVTVSIVNDAQYLDMTYTNCHDTCQSTGPYGYNATVVASTTVNGALSINNFAAFGTGVNIGCTVTGTSIALPAQPVGTIGNILSGSGVVMGTTAAPILHFNFIWNDGTTTEGCSSWIE